MDLTIAIVSWNTKDLLRDCLSSVFTQTNGLDYEVWVADNNSSDGSVAMVQEEFPQVKLLENSDNLGFAKANNQILRATTGRYVLLLNSDTRVVGNALEELVAFMDKHPEAGGAGCQLLNDDGSIQVSCGRFPTLRSILFGGVMVNRIFRRLFPNRTFFAEYGLCEEDHKYFQDIDLVKGCCLMVRRSVLDAIGLLDENIFMYFEEIDLCYRIKRTGHKVLYTPQCQVVHVGGRSGTGSTDQTIRRRLSSQEYFFRKHHGKAYGYAVRWVVAIGSILRVPVFLATIVLANGETRRRMKSKFAWNLRVLRNVGRKPA